MPFGIPNESLHIAPPPHVRVTLKYISMYFLIVCRLVFLFSLLCAVWQKTRSQNRRRRSKSIFFVFSYFVPTIAFLFSLLCAVWHSKRVSPHRTSAPRASDLEIYFDVFPYCVPASLFIFFTSCRLAKNKIAKSQETIQIHFLCIFLFCAC